MSTAPFCCKVGPCDARERIAALERDLAAQVEGHKLTAKEASTAAVLRAENAKLRDALDTMLVPYREAKKNGLPSGLYIQRFRFEQAEQVLGE